MKVGQAKRFRGPAVSSSSEFGAMTNKTSMRRDRVIIFGHGRKTRSMQQFPAEWGNMPPIDVRI